MILMDNLNSRFRTFCIFFRYRSGIYNDYGDLVWVVRGGGAAPEVAELHVVQRVHQHILKLRDNTLIVQFVLQFQVLYVI